MSTWKYGNMCDKQCPARCKGNVCEKDSGDCTDGCTKDMIIGDKCDDCLTGWYGQYCNMSCSVGCKNQRCKKSYGECSYGCLDNFVGGQCNQCMSGKCNLIFFSAFEGSPLFQNFKAMFYVNVI
jgi:hypothetical protein